jgi:FMN phosphatase YigB (HAD superfamily)
LTNLLPARDSEVKAFVGPAPGLAPEECLMVGNASGHDRAARQVGIPTFLVDTWLEDRCNSLFASDFRGSHSDR